MDRVKDGRELGIKRNVGDGVHGVEVGVGLVAPLVESQQRGVLQSKQGANRQYIANSLPTADRLVLVASARQHIAPLPGGGRPSSWSPPSLPAPRRPKTTSRGNPQRPPHRGSHEPRTCPSSSGYQPAPHRPTRQT